VDETEAKRRQTRHAPAQHPLHRLQRVGAVASEDRSDDCPRLHRHEPLLRPVRAHVLPRRELGDRLGARIRRQMRVVRVSPVRLRELPLGRDRAGTEVAYRGDRRGDHHSLHAGRVANRRPYPIPAREQIDHAPAAEETGASRHQDRLLAIHHPLPSLACPPRAGTWQDRTGIPSTAQIRPVPRPARASSAQTTRLARRRQHRAAPRSQGRMAAPQAPAALGCCTMRQRTLGGTMVHVSPICRGAMMFGAWGETDHDAAIRIVHRALEAGVNFIDTADVYSRGESEEIVGKALSDGRRENVVLATKFYGTMGDDPNQAGNSRRWSLRGAEASLRRLQTDWIDLYQVHRWDPWTDHDETLSALSDLETQGKVRYVGSSTYPAAQIV